MSWPKKELKNTEVLGGRTTLINAHFDTVQGSPGGADDGVGIACMMETARVIASGPPLKNPVVFLFNGAEEAIQLVSVVLTIVVFLTAPLVVIGRSCIYHQAQMGPVDKICDKYGVDGLWRQRNGFPV